VVATSKTTNEEKITQLRDAWNEMLAQTLRRGFYGSVGIVLSVQDGTIQHLERHIEQIER